MLAPLKTALKPLQIGDIVIETPLTLAPMAGHIPTLPCAASVGSWAAADWSALS